MHITQAAKKCVDQNEKKLGLSAEQIVVLLTADAVVKLRQRDPAACDRQYYLFSGTTGATYVAITDATFEALIAVVSADQGADKRLRTLNTIKAKHRQRARRSYRQAAAIADLPPPQWGNELETLAPNSVLTSEQPFRVDLLVSTLQGLIAFDRFTKFYLPKKRFTPEALVVKMREWIEPLLKKAADKAESLSDVNLVILVHKYRGKKGGGQINWRVRMRYQTVQAIFDKAGRK